MFILPVKMEGHRPVLTVALVLLFYTIERKVRRR
jgi:hypothetical protein